MIDEDLYQQATDELNSDKRRPHIWARACALASDDHDEARYLYTNLRVEELIAEREASGNDHSSVDAEATDFQVDATLAMEPLERGEDIPESVSAPSGVDLNRTQKEILSLDSAMAENNELIDSIERKSFEEKFDDNNASAFTADQNEEAYSDDYLDETINLTSELDGTAVFELDSSDATEFESDNLVGKDSGARPVNAEDNELEALLGGVYEGSALPPHADPLADDDTGSAMTLEFSDVTGSHGELDKSLDESLNESLGWQEGELAPEEIKQELQQYSPNGENNAPLDETDRLAQELERQADELPGQRSDIVSDNHGNEEDEEDEETPSLYADDQYEVVSSDTFDEEAERDVAESLQRKSSSKAPTTHDDEVDESLAQQDLEDEAADLPIHDTSSVSDLPAAASMAATGVAAASHATERSPAQELPVDLSEQNTGTKYSVFRRGEQAQAVRNGVSWSALFLTLPYLIYRHLFGTALVYCAMWLILLAGLLVSGLAWLDAGSAASSIVKYTTGGFALLALIGLLYLPFRYGNQWREDKLEQRGFELVAWVRASSPGKAISAARRAVTLD